MSLTSRIQALTAYANEVTGESDTTLADAVATLAEGYGQGGITGQVYVEEITYNEEISIYEANTNYFNARLNGELDGPFPFDAFFVTMEFLNNGTATRSGVKVCAKKWKWQTSFNAQDGMVNRVGGTRYTLNYGFDIHAGCTIRFTYYAYDFLNYE